MAQDMFVPHWTRTVSASFVGVLSASKQFQ